MPLGKGVSLEPISAQDLVAEFEGHFERSISRAIGHASRSLLVAKDNEFNLEPSEVSQIFLFALWLTQPTRAHTKWRFRWSGPQNAVVDTIYDHFQHNPTDPLGELTEVHLESVRVLMPRLAEISKHTSPRLRSAFVLSLRACEAFDWAVSLVCYVASLEHLLTYSDRKRTLKSKGKPSRTNGSTWRLATAYASIIATQRPERDQAFQEFKRIYKFRSDIVHGRRFQYSDPNANLAKLAEVQTVVRRLWQAVLADPDVQTALAGDDATRAAYFKQLGYSGPPAPKTKAKKGNNREQ